MVLVKSESKDSFKVRNWDSNANEAYGSNFI